ncbi:MAG TPA: SDR family NAD(P)-dependent oxidoreductase, partial [Thermodesulfovibrionia bacterium]|nr:SDR family NAD(P)-dependent oxidoreductase [Thermodesulfovibrionia bacterium]
VDHTHADLVVAITNTEDGEKKIKEIYGETVLIIPYVMPGFILAKEVYRQIKNKDLSKIDAIILMNHGVFTFDDNAEKSYEKMITIVTKAEEYIKSKGVEIKESVIETEAEIDLIELTKIRKEVSNIKGSPMIARFQSDSFASLKNVESIATRGPLTPDHVIRTKKDACIIENAEDIQKFSIKYVEYFNRNNKGNLTCLDTAPRWGVWKNKGTISFGSSFKDAQVVEDIKNHTVKAVKIAEALGGYRALGEKEIFEMEYWELEQVKLKKSGSKPEFQGKIALVTGGASGIGKATVKALHSKGACVAVLDINPNIETMFNNKDVLGIKCDLTNMEDVKLSVEKTIKAFGGLDILVNNAGIFTPNNTIEEMDNETWQKSMDINLTAHQFMLTTCIPYLKSGVEPAIVFIASKNVPAPGVGAGAYSVAKAGLTQLARVAALELAPQIRVNILHPDAVFDTGIWTEEALNKRASHYGMSVADYKKRNLLKVELCSNDVAELVCAMAGKLFTKITGAQLPVDGGNERVI